MLGVLHDYEGCSFWRLGQFVKGLFIFTNFVSLKKSDNVCIFLFGAMNLFPSQMLLNFLKQKSKSFESIILCSYICEVVLLYNDFLVSSKI